ncbi:MAG: hypothetical protein EBR81_01980 [Proteobacteria bacterium]|nr:hypothetical protein [Pseudomonadota bacterium]
MQLALANIVREGNSMVKTGKELRKQLILTAAQEYQDWENRRRFWRRVSITCAIIAVFLGGVSVGLVLS